MKFTKSNIIPFFIYGLIITFVFISCNNTSKDNLLKPSIVFNEEVHDFGKVKEGPQLEYYFRFTNKGGDTLKILDVKTKCGCTAAVTDKKVYFKEESGAIKVTFNTQGRHGVQEKDIIIVTNDLNNKNKRLSVKAYIE